MTEEEKEAIEKLEELSQYCALKNINRDDNVFVEFVVAIQKTENLIQKQQSELEKKDKMINIMSEQLAGLSIFDIEKDEIIILGDKNEVKQYFERKVK